MRAQYDCPYDALVLARVRLDSHESDLYALATPISRAIIKDSGWYCTSFTSQIDGRVWFEVPFAYQPWWDKRKTAHLEATDRLNVVGTK